LSGTEAAIGVAPLVLQTSTAEAPSLAPKPAGAAAAGVTRVALQAPPNNPAGEEFDLVVRVETGQGLRSGLLDFAFDPSRLRFVRAQAGALLAAADKAAALKASAPEA